MYRQSEKNLLSSNTSSTCPDNMVNFCLLTAEICWRVWAPLQISTGFASWQHYCRASSSGRQPNFAALNRGRHLCSAGRPSGWALAHILVLFALLSRFDKKLFQPFMFRNLFIHLSTQKIYSLSPVHTFKVLTEFCF